jgi:protein ImuB
MFACIYSQNIKESLSLADFAYAFSPLVEETKPDTVVIDVEGCELLFGSAYELANEVAFRAGKSAEEGGIGCQVNVAIASNPDTAIHAAKLLKGITYISTGEEFTCLGDFPVPALDHSLINIEKKNAEEIFETLRLWGVRTFRDFASLPITGVSERLGSEGIQLQQLAGGKTQRHLKLKQPAPVFANSIELEHALDELEPLAFIFARLLNQLCATLNAYALATNELLVQLKLEDQTQHERSLNLPYPMRDHKVFLKLLLLDTEMHPPQAAIKAISITCEPVKPRVLQNGLFTPLAPEPEKLELTLARLAKLVGGENVGSPELIDTHRPDAFRMKRFVLKSKPDFRKRGGRSPNQQSAIGNRQSTIGFRMFRPPLRAMVQANQGCPTQVSAWNKQRSVYGRVVSLAGPWRTTGDWWRTDYWARDEWDVALEPTTRIKRSEEQANHTVLYRIYRELSNGVWFVEGSYD